MDDVFQGFNNWLDIKTMPNGKRRVIKAAVTLFSRQGFDKTSTSQIAQESQMSQATIFKYFRSKKELLLFIIKPMIENILPTTQRILQDNHDGLISWVHFLVNDRYHFLSRNRDAAIILISQVLIDEQVRVRNPKVWSSTSGLQRDARFVSNKSYKPRTFRGLYIDTNQEEIATGKTIAG